MIEVYFSHIAVVIIVSYFVGYFIGRQHEAQSRDE